MKKFIFIGFLFVSLFLVLPSASFALNCTDSDGGKNEYVKGVAQYYDPVMGTRVLADYCSYNVLGKKYIAEEGYCQGDRAYYSTSECSLGCGDGACLSSVRTSIAGSSCFAYPNSPIVGQEMVWEARPFSNASTTPYVKFWVDSAGNVIDVTTSAGSLPQIYSSAGTKTMKLVSYDPVSYRWGTTDCSANVINPVSTTTPTSTPSVTVISPNGGESWVNGAIQTVRWIASSLPAGAQIGVAINRGSGDCMRFVAQGLSPNTTSFNWTVNDDFGCPVGVKPTLNKLSELLGVKKVYADGSNYRAYVVASWDDGNNGTGVANDFSNNYFAITSTTTGTTTPPIASSTPATSAWADRNDSLTHPAYLAIDGKVDTYYMACSNPNTKYNTGTFTVDLGASRLIDGLNYTFAPWVGVSYPGSGPSQYTISSSVDGSNWTNIQSAGGSNVNNGWINSIDLTNLNTQSRYIRLSHSKINDGTGWCLALREFRATAKLSTTTIQVSNLKSQLGSISEALSSLVKLLKR